MCVCVCTDPCVFVCGCACVSVTMNRVKFGLVPNVLQCSDCQRHDVLVWQASKTHSQTFLLPPTKAMFRHAQAFCRWYLYLQIHTRRLTNRRILGVLLY